MIASPRPIADPARRHRVALAVALILLVSAGVRLWQLGFPPDQMFDEIYYAKDAKAIVDGRVKPKPPLRWEAGDEVSWPHPEMGKFLIAAGIKLFGYRSFGWRLPSVLAGMVILACVYPLGRRLGLTPSWAIIALLFAAADPLGIAQSRIATLDVFLAMWSVVCIYFALRYAQDGWRARWVWACGAAGGMAAATKWSGGLALGVAAVILVYAWVEQRRVARAAAVAEGAADGGPPAVRAPAPAGALARRWATLVGALVALPVGIYFLSYVQYFAVGHTWADFKELHRQMVIFSWNLKATHTYASRAYTWIIDYRPVWYYFKGKTEYRGVVAIGNPFLWWLATLSLIATVVLAVTRRSFLLLPAAAIVAMLYLPWFATSRTSFLYYMAPVAPFMAILVAAALCVFAGGRIPRYGWYVMAGAAILTGALWLPVGQAATWLFWDLPRRMSVSAGWLGVTVGILLACAAIVALLMPRMRRYRPLVAMAVAGLVIGIVVAFIPILLALPISPSYWQHLMWFRNWI